MLFPVQEAFLSSCVVKTTKRDVSRWARFCSYSDSGPLVLALRVEGMRSLPTSNLWRSQNRYHLCKNALGCVCLRWSTGDEIDRTLDISRYAVQENIFTGEYYSIVSLSSIVSTSQIMKSSIFICPFTTTLPWPLYQFYINRFFTTKGLQVNSDSDNSENSAASQ